MHTISRRSFIKTSALATAGLIGMPAITGVNKPLLSFSTLGCPDWDFEKIVAFAVRHGYKGIEVRGLQRQLHLPQCPEFSTAEGREKTMVLMKKNGLSFVNLGASANLHLPEGPEREKSLSGARQFIDLAQQVACPYVRVFPNSFPKDQSKEMTMTLIVNGLKHLGDYARERGVVVLMETHGDVVWIADIAAIMQRAAHPSVGLVWDIANMWTITREPPAAAYRQLKKYIRHTHIKDANLAGDKLTYTLLGEGDVPVSEALTALVKDRYSGYYSFEWEKMWHPEIAEPEVALAHYPNAIKRYF